MFHLNLNKTEAVALSKYLGYGEQGMPKHKEIETARDEESALFDVYCRITDILEGVGIEIHKTPSCYGCQWDKKCDECEHWNNKKGAK